MKFTLVNIFLAADFGLLALVIALYIRRTLADRKSLRRVSNESLLLQQKVYQIQVLQEIGERIGYSLDTKKIVDIVTSTLGNLLDYDTVGYMVFEGEKGVIFRCHVENRVNHQFINEVKESMLSSFSAIFDKQIQRANVDSRITGNILDDNQKVSLKSYFNLPIVISGKLVGLINVASTREGQYGVDTAGVLYSITNQASTAVSKLQEVLESEKEKLSAIIYSMTDGVIMVDLNHKLLVSNPAVRSILHIPPSKTDVSTFDIVDALAGKVDLRTKMEQAVSEDRPIIIEEMYLKDRALQLAIAPVKNKQGEKWGATVVFHDITSEKSLEKLRQEFTAMMVHELRAPLTAVRWSSDAMLKNLGEAGAGPQPEKIKESVSTIQTATVNMLELVNDLLDVAKIEAGKFELNIQDYDLVSIIREQALAFKPQAETKHVPINVITPEKFQIKCDRVRVSQVLTNLISNAIKYSDSGQIDINLKEEPAAKRCVISIKDSGVGINQDNLYQLFSKFRQLKSSDSSRKGTGLGLVVSKGIVEAHGGQIWAESAGENLGSTFYFSLPI